jgi:hypothetical protein
MRIINIRYSFLILAFAIAFQTACKKNESLKPAEKIVYKGILSNLNPDHPRLLLTDERLQELKTLSRTDNQLYKYVTGVMSQADKDYVKSPIQYILIGPRLLDKSRECLNRVYNLAFAYKWTGNKLNKIEHVSKESFFLLIINYHPLSASICTGTSAYIGE